MNAHPSSLSDRELDEIAEKHWLESRYSGRDGQDFDHRAFARECERMLKEARGMARCPESGAHCRWVGGECQTCGIVARAGMVDWCGQCDRPASSCAKEGAHRPAVMTTTQAK